MDIREINQNISTMSQIIKGKRIWYKVKNGRDTIKITEIKETYADIFPCIFAYILSCHFFSNISCKNAESVPEAAVKERVCNIEPIKTL